MPLDMLALVYGLSILVPIAIMGLLALEDAVDCRIEKKITLDSLQEWRELKKKISRTFEKIVCPPCVVHVILITAAPEMFQLFAVLPVSCILAVLGISWYRIFSFVKYYVIH